MNDSNQEHRSELEVELDDVCQEIQGSTAHLEHRTERSWEDDEEWDGWKGIGTEEIIRIESCKAIAEALRKTEKTSMSDEDLRVLVDLVERAQAAIHSVGHYRRTLRSDDARGAVAEQLKNIHKELARHAHKWIQQEALDEIEYEAEIARKVVARGKIRTLQNRLSSTLSEAKLSAEETISDMESHIERRTEEAIPSQFSVEAKSARTRGYIWSILSLGLLMGTGWILWDLTEKIDVEKQYIWENIAALVVGKLALAGILGYGIVWTVKMGQACMHEAAVNAHRALSLASLEKGAGGDGESELSQQLAREAAKAIYEPQDTGYVTGRVRGSRAQGAVLQGLRGMMEEMKEKKG